MQTTATKNEDFSSGKFTRKWWLIDASNQNLGRLSSKIAAVLRGKHQPYFSAHVDCGDYIVVINAEKIGLTGKKLTDKIYYHHTGYIGGIKSETAGFKMENKPQDIIIQAVRRMMPKNALNRKSFTKLFVYAGAEHPHGANKPQELKFIKTTHYLS